MNTAKPAGGSSMGHPAVFLVTGKAQGDSMWRLLGRHLQKAKSQELLLRYLLLICIYIMAFSIRLVLTRGVYVCRGGGIDLLHLATFCICLLRRRGGSVCRGGGPLICPCIMAVSPSTSSCVKHRGGVLPCGTCVYGAVYSCIVYL